MKKENPYLDNYPIQQQSIQQNNDQIQNEDSQNSAQEYFRQRKLNQQNTFNSQIEPQFIPENNSQNQVQQVNMINEEDIKNQPKKRLKKKKVIRFEDGFDENLLGDQADRDYLDSLNHLQREKVMEERHRNRQTLLNDKRILNQYEQRYKDFQPDNTINQQEKTEIFTSLKQEDYSKKKKQNPYEDIDNQGSKKKYKTQVIGAKQINPTEDLYLLNKICLDRDYLLMMHNHLYFEEIAKDCLVKIHFGNQDMRNNYKIGIINKAFKKQESYVHENRNYQTYLEITISSTEKWEIKLLNVSNKEMDENEALQFFKSVENLVEFNLDKDWIDRKIRQLKKYANYQFKTEDIIRINEKLLSQQQSVNTLDEYKKRKQLFQKKLAFLEQKYFDDQSEDTLKEIEQVKEQITQIRNYIKENYNDSENFKENYEDKRKQFIKFNRIENDERYVFERNSGLPQNMWSINQQQLQQQTNVHYTVEKPQKQRAINNQEMYEKTMNDFLKNYQRDLSIDNLVDQLVLN